MKQQTEQGRDGETKMSMGRSYEAREISPGQHGDLKEKCLVFVVIVRCPALWTQLCFFTQGYLSL